MISLQRFSVSLLVFMINVCAAAQSGSEGATSARLNGAKQEKGAVQTPSIEMANVLFRYSPELSVLVVRLRGSLVATPGHNVASFNDPTSFAVAAEAAEMRLSAMQLSALMNSWLLNSPKAQLKNLHISVEGDQLVIRGTMRKGVPIPFHATASVGISSDNRIRISLQKVKAADVPVKGLMQALGLSMEDLISQKGLHGLSVDEDSFLIDPQTAFPPPQIRSQITGVRIMGQNLILTFGHSMPGPSHRWKNYIYMRGGAVEYGREEMFDSDLAMIDSTAGDPFEFYLHDYWCQIVNGTIKATPDRALRIYVPDYGKLPRGACLR